MKKKLIGFICCCLFLSISSNAFSQSAVLGAELIKLGDQLQQAIDDAKNAGLSLEVEAGREVGLSLENFKNVYASSLNLTMNKLDTTATAQFESMKSLVSSVQTGTVGSLSDFTDKAQQIINALPFRKHEPQLTATTPRFIVPSSVMYDVIINCAGNFEDAGKPGYTPTLTIGDKVFNSSSGNQMLQFHVPVSVMTNGEGIMDNKFGYVKVTLQVPWDDKTVLGIFSKKRTDKYTLYIGSLPKQPGTITIVHTIDNPRHQERGFNSPQFYQSSASDGGNDDHKGVPYLVTPDAGWNVKRGTSRFTNNWSKGNDWSVNYVSDDANRVSYSVTTIYHRFGTSSQVRFTISFTEFLDDTFQTTENVPYVLNWGDSKIIDFPFGKWKVVFKGFDGSNSEFIGDDATNPFLKINKVGMGYIMSTADPRTLKWPQ